MAVLTRVFFTTKMYGGFCQAAKKVAVITRWPYYRGSRKAGFTVLILGNNFSEEVVVSKEMTVPSDQSMLPHIFWLN